MKPEITLQEPWAAYRPSESRPWYLRWAGHLCRRTAFAGNWDQLQQALNDGPEKSIDRLLAPDADAEAFGSMMDDYAGSAASGNSTESLRAWWLRRMIQTPAPLRERLTLFWHDHFAISNAGVNNAALMSRHIQTLRRGAMGSYRQLLKLVMDDPALYLWLNCERSRKAQPAEHVAQVLLDKYGVGPGNYTETDVRETARALTGRFVLRNELRFFEREYDDGSKTILGQSGAWNAEDAIRIVAQHPATSKHVVRKLYSLLISESETPDDSLIEPLAAKFYQEDDIARLVETMLRSNLFFSEKAYRQQIKSPVELAVGLARATEVTLPTVALGQHLAELGQDLYRTPTSAGWPGGRDWIDQSTLLARHQLLTDILNGNGVYEGQMKLADLAAKYQCSDASDAAQLLANIFYEGNVSEDLIARGKQAADSDGELSEQHLRRMATFFVRQPEFQLA